MPFSYPVIHQTVSALAALPGPSMGLAPERVAASSIPVCSRQISPEPRSLTHV